MLSPVLLALGSQVFSTRSLGRGQRSSVCVCVWRGGGCSRVRTRPKVDRPGVKVQAVRTRLLRIKKAGR